MRAKLGIHQTSKRGKIAIVLPDLRGGGAERLHINLAKSWTQRGWQVEFVLLRAEGDLLGFLPDGATIFELGVDRIRWVLPALQRYLRSARPDVTLVAMWPLTCVGVLAWLCSGKQGRLFLSDHTQLSVACLEETLTDLRSLSLSMRLTYPLATGVIAVSKGVQADICQLSRMEARQITVIHNPAAIESTSLNGASENGDSLWGFGRGARLLSVGTLKPQKDHATLLRAFALLPEELDASLAVLGDGPLRGELSDLAQALGIHDRVRFLGFVPDPIPWFRTADVFVLSSRWEGFANVIVEALSFGVSVVSTDCPSGPSEILEDGRFGELVPVADPTRLALAIAATLTTERPKEPLIKRSRDFAVDAIAARYLQTMGLLG